MRSGFLSTAFWLDCRINAEVPSVAAMMIGWARISPPKHENCGVIVSAGKLVSWAVNFSQRARSFRGRMRRFRRSSPSDESLMLVSWRLESSYVLARWHATAARKDITANRP